MGRRASASVSWPASVSVRIGDPATREQLGAHSPKRTIYRDVADLMAQRVPITGEAGIGYVLERGFDMPPLMLTQDEIDAAVLGACWVVGRGEPELAAAALSLLGKIEAVVPEPLKASVAHATTSVAPVQIAPECVSPRELRRAIRLHRKLSIEYRTDDGCASSRVVWPILLGYGLLPNLIGGAWNWQGKLMALAVTIAIAALPAFGFRRVGLTVSHEPGSLKAAAPVAAAYCLFFVGIAMLFPADQASAEDVAFQLMMPGLEEELFYRGILLSALDQAFRGRKHLLGVDWGWGAVLSSVLFGMTHAFGYSDGSFSFDPITMALTGIPSFIAAWLRLRTGSLLIPIVLHNFGNSFSFLV